VGEWRIPGRAGTVSATVLIFVGAARAVGAAAGRMPWPVLALAAVLALAVLLTVFLALMVALAPALSPSMRPAPGLLARPVLGLVLILWSVPAPCRPVGSRLILPNTPLAPLAPLAPLTPLAPLAPLAPLTPLAPLAPLAPLTPLTPLAPLAPLTPLTPLILRVLVGGRWGGSRCRRWVCWVWCARWRRPGSR